MDEIDGTHAVMIDISFSKDSNEIMVRYPNGRIVFMSTWDTIKLLWRRGWTRPFGHPKVRINGEEL